MKIILVLLTFLSVGSAVSPAFAHGDNIIAREMEMQKHDEADMKKEKVSPPLPNMSMQKREAIRKHMEERRAKMKKRSAIRQSNMEKHRDNMKKRQSNMEKRDANMEKREPIEMNRSKK